MKMLEMCLYNMIALDLSVQVGFTHLKVMFVTLISRSQGKRQITPFDLEVIVDKILKVTWFS